MKDIRLAAFCALFSVAAVVTLGARNSGGTYSIPTTGYPFVSGTAISSSVVNGIFNDIATEITDSASRSGKGGFTAPVRAADGTAAAPSFSFTSDTDVGLYRAGANDVRMSAGNTAVQQWTATGTAVTGTLSSTGALSCTGNFAVNTDKFTVAAASGNTVVAGTLAASGVSRLTAGITTGPSAPFALGDIRVQRAATPTTGFVEFGNADIHYLFWDGTRFVFGDGPDPVTVGTPVNPSDAATMAYVNARFVVAGRVTGATGAIASQTGSVTATCVRNGAGDYTVSVPGLTANAIVTAVNNSYSSYFANPTSIDTGQFRVYTVNYLNSGVDSDFSFIVVKL